MGFLQMVPSISTSGGEPILWGPLAIILMVTACKDLFEDLKRKNDDNKENTSKTLRLNPGSPNFTQTNWANLRVGDIVQVRDGEFIPADIMILKTSEANGNEPLTPPHTLGSCYIETKNLDGETNLKFKNVDKKLLEYYTNDKGNLVTSSSLVTLVQSTHRLRLRKAQP
jgi:phospholipid-transporting ATPase